MELLASFQPGVGGGGLSTHGFCILMSLTHRHEGTGSTFLTRDSRVFTVFFFLVTVLIHILQLNLYLREVWSQGGTEAKNVGIQEVLCLA